MAWHHLLSEGFSLHQDMIAHQQKKVAEEQESELMSFGGEKVVQDETDKY
jgi:hypothetical protein